MGLEDLFFSKVAPTKKCRPGVLCGWVQWVLLVEGWSLFLSSTGSSRLMITFSFLHENTHFTDYSQETVKTSFSHSYKSQFMRQLIALPSHG